MTAVQDVFVIPDGAAGALAELERRKFTAEEGVSIPPLPQEKKRPPTNQNPTSGPPNPPQRIQRLHTFPTLLLILPPTRTLLPSSLTRSLHPCATQEIHATF